MSDREQEIRQRAYQIWESEGRPEGCESEHWERACREIGAADPLSAVYDGPAASLEDGSVLPLSEKQADR
jgi:hypothetical protein